MRYSLVGEHFDTKKEVMERVAKSAECTHNHPEGIKGAVTTAMCIYMARTGASKEEIFEYTAEQHPKSEYKYSAKYSLYEYKDSYKWDVSCQGSVPTAVRCFYEGEDYESFVRNVFSPNCDRDTLSAIGGGIAEEFYHGTVSNEEELLKNTYMRICIKL